MPTACILKDRCQVSLESERLIVRGQREEEPGREVILREIPLRDLERVIVDENTQFSGEALCALFRASIPVSWMGWNGEFVGGFVPATKAHGLARLRQYEKSLDPAFGLGIARDLISSRLYNQRRVVQRLAANRGSEAIGRVAADLAWLDACSLSIRNAGTIDELRGLEGASTARYFKAWGGFLPPEFPFERRSTRPPLNAVNACISYGATLLHQEMVAAIHGRGLDPALGVLHSTEDGRWSLALDLMEPFRPVLVEALALDLFSHQILSAEHFEPRNGGIYLNQNGRRKFHLQYERRMDRQFLAEIRGHRTSLRQELDRHAMLYKSALEQLEQFESFVMN
jgi:CRISP-associated protein Cas1